MAFIINNIPIMSRDEAFAKRLTGIVKEDIKKRKAHTKQLCNAHDRIKNNIETASKVKQNLEACSVENNNIIKESEAAKAYNGLK